MNFDGARLDDSESSLVLDLTSRTGTLAALRWLDLFDAIEWAQRPPKNNDAASFDAYHESTKTRERLRFTIESRLRDWVLVLCDEPASWIVVSHQGTSSLDREIENDGAESFMRSMVDGPPSAGVWIYDGKLEYRRCNSPMDPEEWDVEFHGDYREASAVDLAIMGVDYAECMHKGLEAGDELRFDFAKLVGHPAFRNDWLADPPLL